MNEGRNRQVDTREMMKGDGMNEMRKGTEKRRRISIHLNLFLFDDNYCSTRIN